MHKFLYPFFLFLSVLQAEVVCEGIILLGQDSSLVSSSKGIEFYHLNVPGNQKELEKKLSPCLGEPIDSALLKQLTGTIQAYYENKNRPLVAIVIPEQEIMDGIVQVRVTESRLGNIQVEGDHHTPDKLLKNYLGVSKNDPIDTAQLRDRLEFMNRNPFRTVNLIYSSGNESNTTDLSLLVDDRKPFRFYAGANNEGVPTTGREQCFAGFNCARMFSLDHFFSYQYTATDNFSSFQAHTAQYIAFLPWRNVLNIYGGYSNVHVDLPFPSMKNHGNSYQASGRYIVPFHSSKDLTHEGSVGFDFKRTNNTIEFSEVFPTIAKNVNLSQFVLRYGANYAQKSYELGFDGELFFSPGTMMGDQTDADFSSLRPEAKNHWVYGRIVAKYLQKLPASFYMTCIGRGQLSSQNLLPSEQIGLGGFDSVRGYDERQLNYDSGVVINTELLTPAFPVISFLKPKKSWKDALQFLAFIDYGYGGNHALIPGEKKQDYLLGVGPAVRYIFDPWLTARLDYGVKIHKESTFTGGNGMWYFSVIGNY